MKSIRIFLLAMSIALVCLGNFLAALKGYRQSFDQAQQMLDSELAEQARLITQLLNQNVQLPNELFNRDNLYQVIDSGKLVWASNNARDNTIAATISPGYHFISYQSRRWRILLLHLPDNHTLVVGKKFDTYISLINDLLINAIIPLLWILPLLAALLWLVVSFGLSPLKKIAGILKHKSSSDFAPIMLEKMPQELNTVVHSINEYQRRLQQTIEREQRFSNDAAHELRTPLTSLKLGLFNIQRDLEKLESNNTTEAMQITVNTLDDSLQRMTEIIEQLLTLYRISPENFAERVQTCDLTEITRQQIIQLYDAISRKNHDIQLNAESVELEGEPFALAVMIKNLIDNAVKYTPENGRIQITLSCCDKFIQLRIEDSGPGVPDSDYNNIFNRFYRVGADRNNSKIRGSGLGLAIVDNIVGLHHGSIAASRSDLLGGFAISIQLPRYHNPSGMAQ